MRELSDSFIGDLQAVDGLLHSVLTRVHHDQTLMLSIRSGYINLYYRGGSILKLSEQPGRSYKAEFDLGYTTVGDQLPHLPKTIRSSQDAEVWVDSLQILKGIMDRHLSSYPKPERVFQQVLAFENNVSRLSNETEYFITDIEFADSDYGLRFDLLALQWLARDRRSTERFRPVLLEMKYGDDALSGGAGILKHLQDIRNYIADREKYLSLVEMVGRQFTQLDQLDLIRFNRTSRWNEIVVKADVKPEVVFVLAGHNPRSTALRSILDDGRIDEFASSGLLDLRFFVSTFAGYALHSACMVTLEEIRHLLRSNE